MNTAQTYGIAARRAASGAGGWHGEFWTPGRVPELVQLIPDSPTLYWGEAEALAAAGAALCSKMNSGPAWLTPLPDRIERLSGSAFLVLLAELDLTLTAFARIYGTSQERADKWANDLEPIPHPVRVLLEVLKADKPRLVLLAEHVTRQVSTRRIFNAAAERREQERTGDHADHRGQDDAAVSAMGAGDGSPRQGDDRSRR